MTWFRGYRSLHTNSILRFHSQQEKYGSQDLSSDLHLLKAHILYYLIKLKEWKQQVLRRMWRKSTFPISFMETTWDIIGSCKILPLQSQHLGKLGHADPEIETSLGCRVRYCLRNNYNNKTGQPKQHRPCLNKTKLTNQSHTGAL